MPGSPSPQPERLGWGKEALAEGTQWQWPPRGPGIHGEDVVYPGRPRWGNRLGECSWSQELVLLVVPLRPGYRRTQGQPPSFFLGALGGLGGSSCSWYFLWEEAGESGPQELGQGQQEGGSAHRTARTSCSKASSTLRRSLAEASK